jgi:hypothetical protein
MVEQRMTYHMATGSEDVIASELFVPYHDGDSLLVLYADRYKSSGDHDGIIMRINSGNSCYFNSSIVVPFAFQNTEGQLV